MFVRHEDIYIRMSPCKLKLVNRKTVQENTEETVDNDFQDVENDYENNQTIDNDKIMK